MALTRKQQRFVDAYLVDWVGSVAARKAGVPVGSSREMARRWLQDPEIAATIAQRVAEETHLSPDEVLARLGEHARGDIGLFFKVAQRWTEEPRDVDEILEERVVMDDKGHPVRLYLVRCVTVDVEKLRDPATSRLIKKFSDSPKNGITLELHDAQSALQTIGKALGVLTERLDVRGELAVRRATELSDDELSAIAAGCSGGTTDEKAGQA